MDDLHENEYAPPICFYDWWGLDKSRKKKVGIGFSKQIATDS